MTAVQKHSGNNKAIAKNTFFLYFRMMLLMFISLYTSRIVLQALGETDFGIYETVGGVVAFLSFLNGVLASATSRFLSFEIGRGDPKRMSLNFSTIINVHIALGVLIVIVSEIFGMWFIYHKMTIPPEKIHAAVVALQCSTVAAFMAVTQVPYNSSIISHERMNIYAYLSLFEAFLKLGIVFLLLTFTDNRLEIYSAMIMVVNIIVALCYRWYCICNFKETKYRFIFDKRILKDILGYSFWNLLTNITMTLKNQGVVLLLAAFFNPAIVTARAVANKANISIKQFADNFRLAVNPQIIKRYSAGDLEGSRQLTIIAAKFNFYLMWLLGFPVIMVSEPLLKLWLGEVPMYSVIFLQLIVAATVIDSTQNTLYTAMCAVGKLRLNSILTSLVSIGTLPVAYVFFKLGYSPVSVAYIIFFDDILLSFLVKPYALVKVTYYTWKDVWKIYAPCFLVVLVSLPIPIAFYIYRDRFIHPGILSDAILAITTVLLTFLTVWYIGVDKEMRGKIIKLVKNKIEKKFHHER